MDSKKLGPKLKLIVACLKEGYGIGHNGEIPWNLPQEMKLFKEITTRTINSEKTNIIVMGRKTYQSVKNTPLSNRVNVVISRTLESKRSENLAFFNSLEDFFESLPGSSDVGNSYYPPIENIFIIGGAQLYHEVLDKYHNLVEGVYLSLIENNVINKNLFPEQSVTYTCDTVFEADRILKDSRFKQAPVPTKLTPDFTTYYYKKYQNPEEQQYLDMIKNIIENGDPREDRTKVGTRALFGQRMEFNLENQFPLLTTKKVGWKTVLRELLWFLSGSTDATELQDKKVRIWDGNTTREFLDSRGLHHLPVGDIGSGYGHQWRHFGASYNTCKDDYTGEGVDQIKLIIDLIKNDPASRRILLSAWNPAQQKTMALAPCHILVQFFVREGKYLDSQLYQRSADMGLGVPFNIASYAFLTYMIAHVTNLKPGKFVHITGDTHVYNNHIEPLKTQITRDPYHFPKLEITREVEDIFDFKEEDFKLHDYQYYPTVKMSMAI